MTAEIRDGTGGMILYQLCEKARRCFEALISYGHVCWSLFVIFAGFYGSIFNGVFIGAIWIAYRAAAVGVNTFSKIAGLNGAYITRCREIEDGLVDAMSIGQN
jgi:hypothetical protein